MSLATRCTRCGTIFKVVQDQLKVSGGFVRCGRCQEVFSALEGLFDLDREAPSKATLAAPFGEATPAHGLAEFVASRSPPTAAQSATPLLESVLEPLAPAPDNIVPGKFAALPDAPAAPDTEDPDFVNARYPSEMPPDSVREESSTQSEPAEPSEPPEPQAAADKKPSWRMRRAQRHAAEISSMLSGQDEEASAILAEPGAPSFLREAERAVQWQRPRVRASLGVASLLLGAALTVQIAVQFRDALAARWVVARPAIELLCDVMACRVESLRRLGSLSVEASELTRLESAEAYRLNLSLRNRGDVSVTLPWVDLSLTDASGSLIARRALAPSDFRSVGGAGAAMAAGSVLAGASELQLQAVLATRGVPSAGYTVELFYP